MPDAVTRERRNLAIVAALIVALIAYGSLYPFAFEARPYGAGPVWALLKTWAKRAGRGDFSVNVLLYVPLGFIVFRLSRRFLLSLFVGALLSVSIELSQYYEAMRDTAATDVYANILGTLIGALGGAFLSLRLPAVLPIRYRSNPFPALLLVSWLGYRLYPYVPVIDLHKYWNALKPVVLYPSLTSLDLFRHTVIWLVIAALIEQIAEPGKTRRLFLLFAAGTMAAQTLIVGQRLSIAELAGAVLAFAVWLILERLGKPQRVAAIAILLFAYVILWRLDPFTFNGPPRPFGLIPFYSFLHGSLAVNAESFLEKSFFYGALVWLLTECGWTIWLAGIAVALLLLATGVAEIYLPQRSAELTDAVIALAAALVLRLVTPGAEHGRRIVSPGRKPIG